ncbi:MAG: Rieske 2Fe-2S domain-containing protein [Rhodospirillaceae bacterium]|nr:Rieske 2Fe-2S domain-containing protein [Rhodospirillaceae bacterium]
MSRIDYHLRSRPRMADETDYSALIHEDRVHRLIYTDPAIFEAEMEKIFGGVWVYLAHESQVPNNDDFVLGCLGRRPIIVVRDSQGELRALFNRCPHRGATVCRQPVGSARTFQCPYHGWSFRNSGTLNGVPWPDGYATDFKDTRFNLAQMPRVESYRGFIFGTLNLAAPLLTDYLGPARQPLDEWLDRHPGGVIRLCEANRLKFKGNWKLAYDNAADGYHVVFSHRSLLQMENRLMSEEAKGMAFYKDKPDDAPMYVHYLGNGHHYKNKRPNICNKDQEVLPGALWEIEGHFPGMEAYEARIRDHLGDRADAALDLACSEPVNINIFPNLSILGNHIQVFQPLAVDETDTTWFGTAIVDDDGFLEGLADDINAMRMRTQESFPNFGEVDDLTNFEEIQAGLHVIEDEWVYMHRGLNLPDRFKHLDDGTVIGPATDEVFMRETYKVWADLMTAQPTLALQR